MGIRFRATYKQIDLELRGVQRLAEFCGKRGKILQFSGIAPHCPLPWLCSAKCWGVSPTPSPVSMGGRWLVAPRAPLQWRWEHHISQIPRHVNGFA